MVDDPQPSDESPPGESQPVLDRRAREHARQLARQRRMSIVGTVLTLAIVALAVLVVTDTLRVGGSGPSLASGRTTVTKATAPANPRRAVDKLKRSKPPRALSNAAPLRLWVGGDSLSGELGYQLGPMVSKLGIVRAHVDYKVSSGLAYNDVRNWPTRFEDQERQYQPEAVIFMIGANDAPIVGSGVDSTGAPAWEAPYRAKVDGMMDLLVGGLAQRTVFWIGSPPLGSTRYDHGAREVDRLMREEAAKRPTIVYFDAYDLFSLHGEYASSLPDAQGNLVRMRISDGVHFTPAGAQFLAQRVYALLDTRWNLAGQAAPLTPIGYTIEPSGSNVGGVHIGNGSDRSRTSATTAAPVTTAAPASTAAPPPTTAAPPPTTGAPPTTSAPPPT
jgi:hypothetical protein